MLITGHTNYSKNRAYGSTTEYLRQTVAKNMRPTSRGTLPGLASKPRRVRSASTTQGRSSVVSMRDPEDLMEEIMMLKKVSAVCSHSIVCISILILELRGIVQWKRSVKNSNEKSRRVIRKKGRKTQLSSFLQKVEIKIFRISKLKNYWIQREYSNYPILYSMVRATVG